MFWTTDCLTDWSHSVIPSRRFYPIKKSLERLYFTKKAQRLFCNSNMASIQTDCYKFFISLHHDWSIIWRLEFLSEECYLFKYHRQSNATCLPLTLTLPTYIHFHLRFATQSTHPLVKTCCALPKVWYALVSLRLLMTMSPHSRIHTNSIGLLKLSLRRWMVCSVSLVFPLSFIILVQLIIFAFPLTIT